MQQIQNANFCTQNLLKPVPKRSLKKELWWINQAVLLDNISSSRTSYNVEYQFHFHVMHWPKAYTGQTPVHPQSQPWYTVQLFFQEIALNSVTYYTLHNVSSLNCLVVTCGLTILLCQNYVSHVRMQASFVFLVFDFVLLPVIGSPCDLIHIDVCG